MVRAVSRAGVVLCPHTFGLQEIAPYRVDCQRGQDDVMEMIYPQRGLRVFIPKDLGGVVRGVVFEMAHREPSTLVYWHIDDQFLGTTRYHHQLEVNVAPALSRGCEGEFATAEFCCRGWGKGL